MTLQDVIDQIGGNSEILGTQTLADECYQQGAPTGRQSSMWRGITISG